MSLSAGSHAVGATTNSGPRDGLSAEVPTTHAALPRRDLGIPATVGAIVENAKRLAIRQTVSTARLANPWSSAGLTIALALPFTFARPLAVLALGLATPLARIGFRRRRLVVPLGLGNRPIGGRRG